MHSQLCLGVSGNSASNGADVVQLTCNASTGQRWLVRPVSGQSGVFQLLAQTGTERCLDVNVSSASGDAGDDMIQWACHTGANQRFRIMP